MAKLLRYAGQAAFYGLFIGFIGYFSTSPAYQHLPADQALVKLTFSHPGQPMEPCRERSAEELAKLPPNMRIARQCARERSSVAVEFALDGKVVYAATLVPAGLQRDGNSTLYRRLPVAAGPHRISARLKDHVALPDYNYAKQAEVVLAPGQVYVVDFDARHGGFIFK